MMIFSRLNLITGPGAFGLTIAFIITYNCFKSPSLFSWHPSLMALVFLYCSTVAIQAMRRKKDAVQYQERLVYSKFHFALMLVSMVGATAGAIVIFLVKEKAGKTHLTSVHSLWGIATLCLYFINYLVGARETFRSRRSNWQWKSIFHRGLGILGYLCSGVCILYGLIEKWGEPNLGSTLTTILATGVFVLYGLMLVSGIPTTTEKRH